MEYRVKFLQNEYFWGGAVANVCLAAMKKHFPFDDTRKNGYLFLFALFQT